MKVTDYELIPVGGNVWPHGTRGSHGPHNLNLQASNLPLIISMWTGKTVLFNVDQPNEGDNFTLLRILFLKSGSPKPSFVAGLKPGVTVWEAAMSGGSSVTSVMSSVLAWAAKL